MFSFILYVQQMFYFGYEEYSCKLMLSASVNEIIYQTHNDSNKVIIYQTTFYNTITICTMKSLERTVAKAAYDNAFFKAGMQ